MGFPLAGFGDAPAPRANRETLSANKTLTASDAPLQSLDPNGARDVTLPAEAAGLFFVITNRASGAEDITLKNDAGTALATINQYDAAICWCDGTGWTVILGAAATVQA